MGKGQALFDFRPSFLYCIVSIIINNVTVVKHHTHQGMTSDSKVITLMKRLGVSRSHTRL